MKKIVSRISFASLMLMVTVMPAMADSDMCKLIKKMSNVFGLLRTLAFVGAAFIIAGWAWGYISKGEAKLDDVKGKGIGLLIGFTLLFAIGIALSFLMGQGAMDTFGCEKEVLGKFGTHFNIY